MSSWFLIRLRGLSFLILVGFSDQSAMVVLIAPGVIAVALLTLCLKKPVIIVQSVGKDYYFAPEFMNR